MRTIRVPVDAILDWFLPIFLIILGSLFSILAYPIGLLGGAIFTTWGILWILDIKGIIRFETK